MLKYGFENSMGDLLREFSVGTKLKKIINEDDKINPFFEECLEYVDKDDVERIAFFQNAIKDKFPKHFKYDKGSSMLLYRNKKIKENIKLTVTPKEATKIIIDFFHNVVRSFSQRDLEKNKKRTKLKKENKFESWEQIKSQKQKDILIQNYVKKVIEDRLLGYEDYLKIKHVIHEGFLLNKIRHTDIIMVRGKIENIKNVIWVKNQPRLINKSKVLPKKVNDKITDSFYLSRSKTFFDLDITHINFEGKLSANIKLYIKLNM